jgi:glutaredoxin 3
MTAKATLYRMVLPDHTCPYGVAAKEQLEAAGYEVRDCILTTREEVESFKERNGVDTTPLIFIGDEPIGGMAELKGFLAAECEQT